MPELPEVEVVVKGLRKALIGSKILEFKIINKNLRYSVPFEMEQLYINKNIRHVIRRGKYGIILLDGNKHIVFHLGMTGKFKISSLNNTSLKHDHISIKLNNGAFLTYNDVRKFGYFEIINSPIDISNFKKLGIEPSFLEYFENDLYKKIKVKKKFIKSILLDQNFIAGIGNIYASEILFDAKIYPFKKGNRISKSSFKRILVSTKKILNKAILKGGVTIKDYQNITGDLGYFQINLKVYGREGLACLKCKNLIIKSQSGGRSTYYCNICQKN